MTVWRLIKKLERAAWARKYSDLQAARAALAELFGPAPVSELLEEADHRDTTREIDQVAREPRRCVLCTACKTMTHIPTGTMCAQCLAANPPEGLFQFFERRIRELSAPPEIENRVRELVNAPTSLVEMLRWRADEIEQHRTPLGPSVVMLLREAAAALEEPLPDMSGTPAGLCGVEPTHRPDYLGIDRSTTPMFSATVPESTGALTIENVKDFINLTERRPVVFDPVNWLRVYDPGLLENPVCEHGVPCLHVSAFKGCAVCRTSSQLMRPKHVRNQSGGSCDCPAESDGRGCTRSDLECRVRSYHNSRLSVRAWFRKMRAAEFREATRWPFRESNNVIPVGRVVIIGAYEPWTLFDTLAVVERETAPHYRETPERAAWRRLFDPFFDGTR